MNSQMIKVLLTDDHQIVRQGLITLLESSDDIDVIAQADNGQHALEQLDKLDIDIVLMDINMPIMDGIECCTMIRAKHPKVKVIALSMYKEMSFVENMMEKGAKGYLLKSCSKAELTEAIYKVYNDSEHLDSSIAEDYELYQQGSSKYMKAKNVPKISKREKQVLLLISEESTTAEIADKLCLSVTTVETHRKNMLRKLGVKNTAGLMRFAFENQLIG